MAKSIGHVRFPSCWSGLVGRFSLRGVEKSPFAHTRTMDGRFNLGPQRARNVAERTVDFGHLPR